MQKPLFCFRWKNCIIKKGAKGRKFTVHSSQFTVHSSQFTVEDCSKSEVLGPKSRKKGINGKKLAYESARQRMLIMSNKYEKTK